MALSIVELLSAAAITYTSLATRILTVDEPASNRTQQPLAGCWGRTFSHQGPAGCREIAYDACMNIYVFDRGLSKFGACQWWRGWGCYFNYVADEPQLLPEECDRGFIEQNIPGGYTTWYRDFCIKEICRIPDDGGWYSDEGEGFWDQMWKSVFEPRLSMWNAVPYPKPVPGRPDLPTGPWPRDYSGLRWAKYRLTGFVGWAQAIQENCPEPPAWTGVWWTQDLFADMLYSDGTDLYWDQSQCRRR